MTKNILMGHIINLLSIAYADGSITEEEKNLICNISDHLGMTNEEFNHCLATWQETDEDLLKVSMPEAEEDRIAFLKNMTLLMMIDGEIDENERQYISNAAEQYGFDGEEAVDYLINMIHQEMGGGSAEKEDEDLFKYVDDELNISSGKYELESKQIEDAFDTLYLSALRNEEAGLMFMAIPDIDTRLYRLKPEQIELVQKTADQGYSLAKYVLGRYHQVVKPDSDSERKAAELLRSAAKDGVADAYCALAIMLWRGSFGTANKDGFGNLMNEALGKGSPMGIMMHMHDLIHGSHGLIANPKKAIDFLVNKVLVDENAERTLPYLVSMLGDAYHAIGNQAKADECYERAIDFGYFEAYAPRFVNKVMGPNAEFNREMFSMFLDFGCDFKAPECFLLRALENIHFYEKKKDEEKPAITMKIKEDLEQAVALGLGEGAFYLGYGHYYGYYGFEEDNNAAWQWYLKGMKMDDGYSFAGIANMMKDGLLPEGLPENYDDFCYLQGLRRGNHMLITNVIEAYKAGKLNDYAQEIEQIYLPWISQLAEDTKAVPTVVVVNTEGKALICHLEKNDWAQANQLIGAKRLAPVWVDGLDAIAKQVGLTERLTAWVDLEAPREGLPMNKTAARFYPGVIAGDIVFSLADNLYDPMPFYGTEEAVALIQALGADLVNPDVQELNVVVKERKPIQPTRSMLINDGYIARVEPDCKAYIMPCGKNFYTLFEEEIYDPARVQKLYEVGQRLGLPGRLTMWTENTALRKQIVMANTFADNPVGMCYYPGKVVDNIFVAMEDENFNVMMFSSPAQLKAALIAMGLKPQDVIEVKEG